MRIVIGAAIALSVAIVLTNAGAQVPTQPSDTVRVPRADSIAARRDSGAVALDTAALKAAVQKINAVREEQSRVVWLADQYPLFRSRLGELQKTGPEFPLLRSTSTLLWQDTAGHDGVQPLFPQVQFIRNSAIPFSQNNALWAGRGLNTRIIGGAAMRFGRIRIVLAPEIVVSQNEFFPPRGDSIIPSPSIPADRSKFSYPWYANGPYSADLPLRFGTAPIRRLRAGQSSALVDAGPVTFGFSTENEWWGPGIDNALVLSNNAPGFPHLLIRNAYPINTWVGKLDFRWISGGLTTSGFFDTATTRRSTRSIAAATVALRPRGIENLSVGLARSVFGESSGWGENFVRWLDVFSNTGHPNLGAPYDSTLNPGGHEQLYSVFARWALPASGAEVYGEWGRLDFPRGLRDLLVQPNRGQAYTLGLQYTRPVRPVGSALHFRIENTSLEQSLALRDKFAGVWYTSRRVLQGYTNEGEVLGAAVGPGSSGQATELNYLLPRGFFGIEFGRMRYNEDVHQAMPMLDYLRWCSHDVNLQWGWRAGFTSRLGSASVRSLYQNRLNAYFQSAHGCPTTASVGQTDIRNHNFTLTFSPGLRW